MNGFPPGLNDQGRTDHVAAGYAAQTRRERDDLDRDYPSACNCSVHGLCLRHLREQEVIGAQLAEGARRAALMERDAQRVAQPSS